MRTATIFTTVTCCLLAAMCSCNALFCNTCVPEQCPEATNCPVGKVMDSCGCCEVCAIPLEGTCNTDVDFGLCAGGRFCLPDGGLFSGNTAGKCLDITECFSSGCDVIDDMCDCGYSNSCPTKTFTFDDLLSCEARISENSTEEVPVCVSFGCEIVDDRCQCKYNESCPMTSFSYSTLDECENAMKFAACGNVVCESHIVCPEGSYYESGPLLPGNCCPSAGVCWCDDELCPEEPDCPEGFEPTVVTSANNTDGQCCDTYECTRVTCDYEGQQLQHNEAILVDACTTCECYNGELFCHTLSCSVPQCASYEELVLLPGNCCPSCQPQAVIDLPNVPVCEIEGILTDPENPCRVCSCYEGRTSCFEESCSPLACVKPVLLPGTCCPICEEDLEKAQTTTAPPAATTTETEEPISAEYFTDTVTRGEPSVQPHEEVVDEIAIDPPHVPLCEIEGVFTDPENPCRVCSCYEGETACYEEWCAPTACDNPILLSGACCSICEEHTTTEGPAASTTTMSSTTAEASTEEPITTERFTTQKMDTIEETTNKPIEIVDPPPYVSLCEIEGVFTDPENPCRVCSCYNGRTACFEEGCAPVECEKPVLLPGTCCPVCAEQPTSVLTTEAPSKELLTTEPIAEVLTTEKSHPTEEVTEELTTELSTEAVTEEQVSTVAPSTTTEQSTPLSTDSTLDLTTHMITDATTIIPFPIPEITFNQSPYVSQHCTIQQPYRSRGDACLTCMCINEKERCVDQLRFLCEVPRCKNPVLVEGQCCPICIENDATAIPAPDSLVALVTMIVDAGVINLQDEVMTKMIEEEMKALSYSLLDIQAVAHGKTQVELVLAVERLDEATDETHDLIKVAILERLSSTSSPTQEDTVNTGSKTQLTGNVVLIVCVLSVLVAVILLTLSGILLACVWIARLNKERAKKLPSTEKV